MNNSATAIKELVLSHEADREFEQCGTRDCSGENGERGTPLRLFVTPRAMFSKGFVALFPQEELVRDICYSAISECAAFRLWQFWHRATLRNRLRQQLPDGNEILIFDLVLSIAAGIGSIVVVH